MKMQRGEKTECNVFFLLSLIKVENYVGVCPVFRTDSTSLFAESLTEKNIFKNFLEICSNKATSFLLYF